MKTNYNKLRCKYVCVSLFVYFFSKMYKNGFILKVFVIVKNKKPRKRDLLSCNNFRFRDKKIFYENKIIILLLRLF